jgi:hypothetical protein
VILKAEPDKVLRFLEDNFELVRELYRLQLEHSIISTEQFEAHTASKAGVVARRLFDYKIITQQSNGLRLNEPIRAFFGFLLNEFKPLLPEELKKYHLGFSSLFERIQESTEGDILILAERLDAFYLEVQQFLENIDSNTGQLLKASQQLKANKADYSYSDRIRRARHMVEYYIEPLNRILDVQQDNSIANTLNQVSRFINIQRFEHPHAGIRTRFDRLHDLLRDVDRQIIRQSHIITRELLPLIERLQTESEILTGWLSFLERPLLNEVPPMPARRKFTITGSNVEASLQLFLQQFERRPKEIILKEEDAQQVNKQRMYFNRRNYERRFNQALPVTDYFSWCLEAMRDYESAPDTERFLKISSLLFENGEQFELEFTDDRVQVELDGMVFDLPVIAVQTKKATAQKIEEHAVS